MYCPLAVVWSLSRTQVLALLSYQKPGWVPSVWYTIRPGAGAGTLPVPMARRAASVRRGSRAPLLLLAISRAAEGSGAVAAPMVTPVWAWALQAAKSSKGVSLRLLTDGKYEVKKLFITVGKQRCAVASE